MVLMEEGMSGLNVSEKRGSVFVNKEITNKGKLSPRPHLQMAPACSQIHLREESIN